MSGLKNQIVVGIDVGFYKHRAAIADSTGHILEEFDITHDYLSFSHLFYQLYTYERIFGYQISVAMEGVNGLARPLDQIIASKGYKLLNVNNLKLSRFREIFPAPAKTDELDAREIVKLVFCSDHLNWGNKVIQEVKAAPKDHKVLKRLTRRRRQLVEDKARIMNRFQCDLHAVSPELLKLVDNKDSYWFLNLLTCRDNLEEISRIRRSTILKIYGIGKKYADKVQEWQKDAHFSEEIDIVGPMIILDANRILELKESIKQLDEKISSLVNSSELGQIIGSIPGFGDTSTGEIVGEIGTMERFIKEESLAYYMGMAPLDNSSGTKQGTKTPRNVNTRLKGAMMSAVAHNIRNVPVSKAYYDKKRAEGKKHNQAVRSLGRHMVRVIWAMVKSGQKYRFGTNESVKKEENNNMAA